MGIPLELTLEQEFNLKVYEEQVKKLTLEQSQEFVLELLRQLMIKDNVIKHLLKQTI
ncbi:MAG: NblA/ycf18 family protein [Pseudanabaenaceae cyanobacterium SKYGB_i_bin29]|nr:NblA/ycf18 family protein [Pseudanabaenaceae cyanobacterium SKYG29]MDW8421240.1 NblA/ycf18 family protein [Pseudanabaenaceae cyanobacterium SKYGB_i_bin29]